MCEFQNIWGIRYHLCLQVHMAQSHVYRWNRATSTDGTESSLQMVQSQVYIWHRVKSTDGTGPSVHMAQTQLNRWYRAKFTDGTEPSVNMAQSQVYIWHRLNSTDGTEPSLQMIDDNLLPGPPSEYPLSGWTVTGSCWSTLVSWVGTSVASTVSTAGTGVGVAGE